MSDKKIVSTGWRMIVRKKRDRTENDLKELLIRIIVENGRKSWVHKINKCGRKCDLHFNSGKRNEKNVMKPKNNEANNSYTNTRKQSFFWLCKNRLFPLLSGYESSKQCRPFAVMMDSHVGGDFVSCEYKYSVNWIYEAKIVAKHLQPMKIQRINHLNMTFRVRHTEKDNSQGKKAIHMHEPKIKERDEPAFFDSVTFNSPLHKAKIQIRSSIPNSIIWICMWLFYFPRHKYTTNKIHRRNKQTDLFFKFSY